MKVRVVWLGRPSASPYESQVETYRKRVARRWPSEDRPLRPISGGRDRDPARALRLEAETLERQFEAGWHVVALDERARDRPSRDFATWLAALEDGGRPGVMFVVGSDLGLDGTIIERADGRLSLSSMTLPHLLARLVLWEQLFRSTQILGGGAYHRVGVQ
ncbi:MAG: 23S rRNA (pseudouridine(1915)-N(3))-methyltransferase RlmH [Acidobacteriota bacterium]|nr:23S rRNA (pseudouridine(1915)-N(3))-methyltransferase RlmH [Acidobacteriota bacterium]